MPRDPLFKLLGVHVPVIQCSVAIACHRISLWRRNVRLDRSVEEIRMFELRYGLVHLHVDQVNRRALWTRHQSLVTVWHQSNAVYRVIHYALNLGDRSFALSNRVNSNTAIPMSRVYHRFHSVRGHILYTLSTGNGQQVGILLNLPNLDLSVLRPGTAFLPRTGPCHTVNLLAMPNEGMQRLSCLGLINSHCLVSASCQHPFPAVVQHRRQENTFGRIALNCHWRTHV